MLVAAGIGITPMVPMALRLAELGKPFSLHVCTRSEAALPLRDKLGDSALASHVSIHPDKADGRPSLDPSAIAAQYRPGSLLYICGPAGFMDWLRQELTVHGWPADAIRVENFAAAREADAEQHPFEVRLARSNRMVPVSADESIIDALARTGLDVPFACMQGTCGTCIMPVLSGAIDHRDAFLSPEDKARGDHMCLCVSRAKEAVITLDL